MHRFCLRALCVCLAPAALFSATVTTEGTFAVTGGAASLDGDLPAFQQATQHKKNGYGGLEEFSMLREAKDSVLKFDARIMPGDDDYRLKARFDYRERFYIDAGYEQFRVWYDGSSGYFRPRNLSFVLFDEDLSVERAKLWAEAGATTESGTYFKLRYERRSRDGTKGSTHWADTNLVGAPYGTRNIVPSFYDLDEVTNTFTFDVGNESSDEVKWNVGSRYSETTLDNKRYNRRRPGESADRIITTKDQTKTDIFAAHGFYLRQVSEELTVSGGALITTLDSNISGSRIYGQTYDPVFDPAYLRRQQRDEGFYALEGESDLKQTVLNLNAVYVPKKNWSVRPSVRFENLHQETLTEFIETNIGAGPAFAAILEDVEAEHKKEWDEFSEAIEVRYTGKPNWTYSAEAEFVQGSGDLEEERMIHHTGALTIDRDSEIKRSSQKYSFTSNWYAKPGLTFAVQYYHKIKANEYDAVRDNTVSTSDRYPAYITDQDFETDDFNVRVSWRPASLLSFVTRYDYQESVITSKEAGLAAGESSDYVSHIISQSATWSPTGRLYVTGNVNVTFDQLATPAYAFVKQGDNNYVNGSLGGGYALAKLDDLYFDYAWFRADNFIDNSATSLPYGLSQKQQTASVTWVRRQNEHLTFTVKYGYITNRDDTYAGMNDFDAHTIYGKVQYHF
jgi:hypothetical protein